MIEWSPGGQDGPHLVSFDVPKPRRVREKVVSVESAIGLGCFGAGYLLAAWGPLGATIVAVVAGTLVALVSMGGAIAAPIGLLLVRVLATLAGG